MAARIRAREEIPSSFEELTTEINIAKEYEIIESVWSTTKTTEVLITTDGQTVAFWRRKNTERENAIEREYFSVKNYG